MKKVVLIAGDGIGTEITASVITILEKANAQVEWVEKKLDLPPTKKPEIRFLRILLKPSMNTELH